LEDGDLQYEWVLHLDADEEVSPELLSAMQAAIRSKDVKDGYQIPARIIFMGRWLRYSGMYPCYQVRFGHRDRLRFHQVGHGQRELLPPEKLGTLDGDLVHHNFSKGVSDWFARHARYAFDEASEAYASQESIHWFALLQRSDPVLRRRAMKRLAMHIPFRPLARFLYTYVLRLGFMDGVAGFHYSFMLATYQYMIDLNLREIRWLHRSSRHSDNVG